MDDDYHAHCILGERNNSPKKKLESNVDRDLPAQPTSVSSSVSMSLLRIKPLFISSFRSQFRKSTAGTKGIIPT